MALDGNAVFTAAKGYIFTNAVDAAAPTQDQVFNFVGPTLTTPSGWGIIGHTSRDDLPEFGYDGGDTETRGTWQNEALRTVVTDSAVDFVTFNLVQFDAATFALYYGAANTASETGSYALRSAPGGATTKSLLIIIVDGSLKIAFYAPKVELRRNDAISLAVDEFGALPMRATFLQSETANSDLFRWIPGIDATP
jgi:hypothetical protein